MEYLFLFIITKCKNRESYSNYFKYLIASEQYVDFTIQYLTFFILLTSAFMSPKFEHAIISLTNHPTLLKFYQIKMRYLFIGYAAFQSKIKIRFHYFILDFSVPSHIFFVFLSYFLQFFHVDGTAPKC